MHVVISGSGLRPVVVKAALTIHLAHTVAEAFTSEFEEGRALHHELRAAGARLGPFEHYCVDMTQEKMYALTFCSGKQATLSYMGVVARFANPWATLYLHAIDLVRPGHISPTKARPCFIDGNEKESR